MAVQVLTSQSAVNAVPDPKHVWRQGVSTWVVYTGADIPVAGTEPQEFSAAINVMKFGAKGDGVDDTTAMRKAREACPPGGLLYVPRGVFAVKEEQLFTDAGIRIVGESKNSTQIVRKFSGGSVFRFQGANYFQVENLMMQGNWEGGTTGGNLIYIEGSSYGRASNLRLLNANGYCVRVEQGSAAKGAYFNVLDGLHTYNGRLGNIYCGLESSETKIIGGEHNASKNYAWVIEGGNGHAGIGASFEGNDIGGVTCGTPGFAAEVNLLGCRFEGAGVMRYGVQVINVNSKVSIIACHNTTCLDADLLDPDGARITYIVPSGSATPVSISGLRVNGDRHQLGNLQVVGQGGTWGIKGPSTTRIESAANSVDLVPASGIVNQGQAGGTYNFVGGEGTILAGSGAQKLRLQKGGTAPTVAEGGGLEVASAWNALNLLRIGSYSVWVDAAGRLRIKAGNPTSDTDGAIVGSQS